MTKIFTNQNHNFNPHTLKESALIISEYFSRAEGKLHHGHYSIELFLTFDELIGEQEEKNQTDEHRKLI